MNSWPMYPGPGPHTGIGESLQLLAKAWVTLGIVKLRSPHPTHGSHQVYPASGLQSTVLNRIEQELSFGDTSAGDEFDIAPSTETGQHGEKKFQGEEKKLGEAKVGTFRLGHPVHLVCAVQACPVTASYGGGVKKTGRCKFCRSRAKERYSTYFTVHCSFPEK